MFPQTPADKVGVMAPPKEICELPPLILHPFAQDSGPADVLESSRAALVLAGILPDGDLGEDSLTRKLLKGRWEEIRMLCFIGKDVHRWIEQCAEFAAGEERFTSHRLPRQSFAALLVQNPPPPVQQKLRLWGVDDFTAIFRRSVGLASAFQAPPTQQELKPDFLKNYHRYADMMFQAFLTIDEWDPAPPSAFRFEIYSSGEYSRILESRWSEPN
jgi:hypothetical protein